MPKSKNNKTHKARLASYNANKKKQQEILKKKMMDEYLRLQQDKMKEQAHTSTEDVTGPEINIDELNNYDESPDIDFNNISVESEIDLEPESNTNEELLKSDN